LFVPGKAANAGGVAVSGLEMSQNAGHQTWTTAKVDQYLELIMKDIFHTMQHHGTQPDGRIDYLRGANIGGFIKLFAAMKGLGW
jgi:glutamate dehydrogenase (NADP+)